MSATRVRCDATYATDADGREGYKSVIVAKLSASDPGTASIPVGACSDDRVTIWHGMDTPAIACGRHASGGIGNGPDLSVFRGHRNRIGGK